MTILTAFNYGLVLIFGLFLSTHIAGGWDTQQQKTLVFILCPVFLLIQAGCYWLWGVQIVEQLYPLIIHLPLVLILILALKKTTDMAVVSVCMAYLFCQLPRWVSLAVTALTDSVFVGEVAYTLVIVPIFFLLRRFVVQTTYCLMTESRRSLLLLGSLPAVYYVYDYATTVYHDILSSDNPVLTEFLPTALILFYVLFLLAYHRLSQKQTQAELERSMLEAELKQSGIEIENLRHTETQAAIYRHDIRHHLSMIQNFLSTAQPQQAEAYIQKVQADVEAITPQRFCANETVNLVCASFSGRAKSLGIQLSVDARLPNQLPISDTELCALLSNGLENALHAASTLEPSRRWTNLYCGIRMNKLLIEIRNPYDNGLTIRNGIPISNQSGHGYGCRSILSIAQQNRGICTFEPENGIFSLRVVLPVTFVETT